MEISTVFIALFYMKGINYIHKELCKLKPRKRTSFITVSLEMQETAR